MHEKPIVARKKLLTFGFISVLFLLSLMTAQVALAGPSAGPSSQSTVPGTLPPPPPPPPPEIPDPGPAVPPDRPDLAPPTTASYNWTDATTINVDLFKVEEPTLEPGEPDPTPQPKVVLKVPSQAMSVGGQSASGQITVKPVSVSEVTPDTIPDLPTLEFSGRSIEITIFGLTSDLSAQDITDVVRFNPPLEIGFDITDAEWEEANKDITRFQVRFFSVQESRWIELTTTVDPFQPSAKGFTTHLTTFGLFIDSRAAGAPDGGDISPSAAVLALMGLLGLILLASGALYLRRGSRATP